MHVTLELVSAIMLTINIIIIIITIILSKFTFIIIILYHYCFSSAQRLSSAWPNCSSRCKVRKLLCHSRGLCRIQGAAVPMITNYIDIYCFIYPSFCFTSPSNLLNFPKQLHHLPNKLLHIPNRLLQFPKKFSLPQHYFASLCQKLEHNFLIFFSLFFIFGA